MIVSASGRRWAPKGWKAVHRILVVEDLAPTAELLEIELKKHGYEVATAGSGEEALAKIPMVSPDLLLLDLNLPDIHGIDIVRSIRSDPRWESLPVILLTASEQVEDRVKGLDAGADDYMPKPFHIEEVLARIRAHLRIADLQQQILERQTMQARIESLGQMLGTLAHHINNATQSISGLAQLCEMDPDNSETHEQLVTTSLRQTRRIAAVLDSVQLMVDSLQLKTTDYAGTPERMLDIEEDMRRRLKELDEE